MSESRDEINRFNTVKESYDYTTIKSLINDLGSKNREIYAKARQSLFSIGESAVHPLVDSLSGPDERVRWEANKLLDYININWTDQANTETIDFLIGDLGSKNGLVRVRARKSLVAIGAKAVRALVVALSVKEESKRWEAAKTLSQIGDPAATQALIRALEDNEFDIRWLAAEGLVTIGQHALEPVLVMLSENSGAIWLREGVHHFLHGIYKGKIMEIIRPVLNALEDVEAPLEVPYAAEKALQSLRKSGGQRGIRQQERPTKRITR